MDANETVQQLTIRNMAENRSEDDSENTIKKHCKGDCTMRILFSALIEMDSVSKKVHVKNKL
jgi:hypothetical protein